MNITDVMYGMRDMAGHAADKLRIEIENAQKILDELDQFANDAEDGAQLIAASDLEPGASALIPDRANMRHGRPGPGWELEDTERHCGCAEAQEMAGPSMYASGNAQPAPVHIGDSRNAAHQTEMNGETKATTEFPQGPRTVGVLHGPTMIGDYIHGNIRYGQAITGWPILKATIISAPRNDSDRDWLNNYLPAYIAPGGEIIHAYKDDANGPVD